MYQKIDICRLSTYNGVYSFYRDNIVIFFHMGFAVFLLFSVIIICYTNRAVTQKNEGRIPHDQLLLRRNDYSISLYDSVARRAVNNTVLLMIVDYGYLNVWNNSYINGNLSHYSNLLVLCMDLRLYNVCLVT